MKHLAILLLLHTCLLNTQYGQVSGNVNYQNQVSYPEHTIRAAFPADSDLLVSVKGLANVKADAYVALFSVTQVGKTTEEVNKLMDERIEQALQGIRKEEGLETYVDMISFVPVYDLKAEKKVFSKKTYNEIPAGFELKKNIHIKYSHPAVLNKIITAFSHVEIYDLVKVDYYSHKLEAIKKELMHEAQSMLKEKLNSYQAILAVNVDSIEKKVTDGFRVVLPTESYPSYQAYNSSSLNLEKPTPIKEVEKSTTLYYQPVMNKEFDFVINPVVLEPVIQVLYEIKLRGTFKKDPKRNGKAFIFVTPNGELKNLTLN